MFMRILGFVLCVFLTFIQVVHAEGFIDLKGKWSFQIDSLDRGVKEKWYIGNLNDNINLPASMPEKLKGDIVSSSTRWTGTLYDSTYYYNPYFDKYRKDGNVKLPFFLTPDRHYVGVAWYQKKIEIPADWKGRKIYLFLERPHIETNVWINGKKVGMQNSLCVPHEYDITEYVNYGKNNTLSISVDNRIKEINVGPDSHSITDQTQGNWNGIVGRIGIYSSPEIHITDVQVYPDVDKGEALVKIRLEGKGKTKLRLSAESFNSDLKHIVPTVETSVKLGRNVTETSIVLPMGNDFQLWDEFNPALYKLKVESILDGETEVKEVQFGMRKFEIKGKWFYVNNRKIMLRGTVENCLFPNTGYPPMDVESWERVFRICRNYGLNHMRFHSYCPPEAAFIAADLVGFYLQPEGPSWPNHGSGLGLGMPIDEYLMNETKALTKAYGNYASFCMLACGNEPYGNWVSWVSDFVDYWKNEDNRRVYTGASVGNGWQWQPKSQYHVKAGARGLTWKNKRPSTMDDYRFQNGLDTVKQPYVSHETGQWCVFPNFNEINKYTGVNKAKNFEIFRDILRDNGMEDMGHKFLMASGKLQSICYKYEIEKTLRTPDYAGFQLLALNDYSGQGSALVGVLDVFFEEKGYIDSDEWRTFCSATVPLMRTSKFIYKNNENLKADIEVAHFGVKALKNVDVSYTVTDENKKVLYSGVFPACNINIGNCNNIGDINIPLNNISVAKKITLEVGINGLEAKNSWNFWVYPESVEINNNEVYITDSLDKKALDILQEGGKVLIIANGKISYGKSIVQRFLPVFWNTSWFKMRPPHTTGIYLNNKHPLFKSFPTDYHSDLQWWELVNNCQVMRFSDFPANFRPLVQSIDTWFLSRKIGVLFEANVLNGKLMMTSMDLNSDLDDRIVARQMRKSILDYMNSDYFRPEYNISADLVMDLFNKIDNGVELYTNDSPDELKPKIN